MMLLLSLSLSLLLIPDSVLSVSAETRPEMVPVFLGQDLVLNCTYNCSTGFIKGCWLTQVHPNPILKGAPTEVHQDPHCPSISQDSIQGDLCTLSRRLSNVTVKDTRYSYSCVTEDTEQAGLPRRTERLVKLMLQQDLSGQMVPVPAGTTAASDVSQTTIRNREGADHQEEFTVVKVLATVSVVVAVVLTLLAAHLCLGRGQGPKGNPASTSAKTSSEPSRMVCPPDTGSSSAVLERVALRITPPDDQSDHEVPYADIMITVRGSSTPELSSVLNSASYLPAGGHRRGWREDPGPGLHPRSPLQACRSADRLLPFPREVNRKMSTSSDYAVITYS